MSNINKITKSSKEIPLHCKVKCEYERFIRVQNISLFVALIDMNVVVRRNGNRSRAITDSIN